MTPDLLPETIEAVAGWQHEGGPVQLHPGDLGWAWSRSAHDLAEAVRVWTRDGRILAAGLIEPGDEVIRLGIAPAVGDDEAFAAEITAGLTDAVQVEARFGTALRALLRRSGWVDAEPWTPLSVDLSAPVEQNALRIETLDADHHPDRTVQHRVAVQRASFMNSAFTLQRWRTMAGAPPYRNGRCLVGYDRAGDAVAAVTVWSAGEGRPGLLEPLGVHRDHRGRGFGRAITLAAAGALRRMGASSATVCTPSSNVGAVATYVSAGYRQHPAVPDFRRQG